MAKRGRIFISYRRGDVPGDARSLYEKLERNFGKSSVFIDIDRLLVGQRFDHELKKALSQCEVLIAIIGPRWMELLRQHTRTGDRDFVRTEIAAALKRKIVVIPVLVGRQGDMPSLPNRSDLPEEIRELVLYQKHDIAHESFSRDADHLASAIGALLYGASPMSWTKFAAFGIGGVALTAVSLGYWMDMLPWIKSNVVVATNSTAFRVGEKEAVKIDALDDGLVKIKAASDCDRLAAAPFDPGRPSGVVGVEKIDAVAAAAACREAMRLYPEVARFIFQAARVAHASNDYAKAQELYRVAIGRGYVEAMTNLGLMYSKGDGVGQDYAEARFWYVKASALGSSRAMTTLGNLYAYEWGVPQNLAEARSWYEKAAALGNANAMYNVASLYEKGAGVKRDTQQARQWYQRAADAGSKEAMEKLESLK